MEDDGEGYETYSEEDCSDDENEKGSNKKNDNKMKDWDKVCIIIIN